MTTILTWGVYTNNLICSYTQGQIGWRDLNENGIIDCIDAEYNSASDSDGDGIIDYWDNCPLDNNPLQEDLDEDEIGDVCDPDDDNDGICDPGESDPSCSGSDICPYDPDNDSDSDGFCGDIDNCSDDFNPNQEDLLDGDGAGDICDNCPTDSNPNQEDSYPPSGNGCGDACECEANLNGDDRVDYADFTLFDQDYGRTNCTIANPCYGDFDCDGDVDGETQSPCSGDAAIFEEDFGRNPLFNPCPTNCVTEPWCAYDKDSDGIEDSQDNCPNNDNPGQADTDLDDIGDVCDDCTDTDGDYYGNPAFPANICPLDNCPEDYNLNQEDFDGDGIGDVCDPDDDGDGICDPGESDPSCTGSDNCPLDYNPGQENYDSDDLGNDCDNCPTDYNPLQEDTYPPLGNGIGNACDCEADFNCDGNVDAGDVTAFLVDFGRSTFFNPCTNEEQCNGDFNCDKNVDAADVTVFLEDFGRSEFFNPCPACEVGIWCEYPIRYLIDDIAGDGGKNFPIPQLITLNAGSTTCVDIYLVGGEAEQITGGMWLDFRSSTADISYVSAGRALTDGSEGVTGPWSPTSGYIVNEPEGPGTLLIAVAYSGVPDEDGDIIVGQVCLRHDSTNDATIKITTAPGVETWTPINDEDIIPGLFVIQQ